MTRLTFTTLCNLDRIRQGSSLLSICLLGVKVRGLEQVCLGNPSELSGWRNLLEAFKLAFHSVKQLLFRVNLDELGPCFLLCCLGSFGLSFLEGVLSELLSC